MQLYFSDNSAAVIQRRSQLSDQIIKLMGGDHSIVVTQRQHLAIIRQHQLLQQRQLARPVQVRVQRPRQNVQPDLVIHNPFRAPIPRRLNGGIAFRNDVHQTIIQENIRESIAFLMNSYDKFPKDFNYVHDMSEFYANLKLKDEKSITYENFVLHYKKIKKNILFYTDNNESIVYDYKDNKVCKMKHILERIWAYAKNDKNCDSIIINLYFQMKEGLDVCFVGQFTRLVNSLSSFINEIEIMSINEKISNEIIKLKNQEFENDLIVEIMKEFMEHLKVSENDQKHWITAINES